MTKRVLGFILLFAIASTAAQAVPITVSFSVSGFIPIFGSRSPPTDPVTGTIVYDAASASSNIDSLTSVDLTIGGHTYGVGELDFISPFGADEILIGGALFGPNLIVHGTDDFRLTWVNTGLQPFPTFAYSVASSFAERTSWLSSGPFIRFSVSVPEPAPLALLLAALLAFGVRRRRM